MVRYEPAILWRRTAHGGVQAFQCLVEDEDDKVQRWTWTESAPKLDKKGKIVASKIGKKRTMEPLYGEAVHVGMANEASPHENAITQAKAEWKKKKDKGYSEDKPDLKVKESGEVEKEDGEIKPVKGAKQKKICARSLQELITPMLLHKYGLKDYPLPERACISAKRNGLCGFYRVLKDDIVSRKDLVYKFFDHLKPSLRRICELAETYLREKGYKPREGDSVIVKAIHMELDLPDEMKLSFQEKQEVLTAKKTRHKHNDKVIACTFDLGDQCIVPFETRYNALVYAYQYCRENEEELKSVQLVRCYRVDTHREMIQSLEVDENGKDLYSFVDWLVHRYMPNPQKWEPEPPQSRTKIEEWWNDPRHILSREARVRLIHRWVVDELKEEGTVIRDLEGLYEGNDYRSSRVLKQKDYEDEEAVVVGAEQAKGNQSGAIIFVLRSLSNGTAYNSVFSEEMNVSVDTRRLMYKERAKYMGMVYTVRFQERYATGIPQFPTIVSECKNGTKTIQGKSVEEAAREAVKAHKQEVEGKAKKKSKAK